MGRPSLPYAANPKDPYRPKRSSSWFEWVFVISVVAVIVGIVAFGMYAATTLHAASKKHAQCSTRFHQGDLVKMKLDGTVGMVTGIRGVDCILWVRFAADSERTSTSWIGPDGDIRRKPYTEIMVNGFEIEKVK